jgi:hypothetical protein
MDEENVGMSSHEVMMWLDDVERDRFVKFQELFESDGWRLLKNIAVAKVTEHGVLGANAKTWEDNRVALGARTAWEDVANASDTFMSSFEQVALQNKEAAADTEESPGERGERE